MNKASPLRSLIENLATPKHDSEESDCNKNLYPHHYRAKVQSQVTPTQPLPGWPKGIRKNNPSNNNKSRNIPDKMSENQQKDNFTGT